MNHFEFVKNKIVAKEIIHEIAKKEHLLHKKIAFTNGCFDLVHRGHIDYLSKARDLAEIVIVGLNTDASVRRLKGPNRPINDEYSRALLIASFLFVDYVVLFEEDTPYQLIQCIEPDVLIKGSDYKAEDIVGYDIVTAKGGHVVTLDFIPGFSTTRIEKKIRNEKLDN